VVASLEQVFRDEWGRVLATLIGILGDFDLAEEAAQEAFAIAARRWPGDGYPSNPRAWLLTTARNRAIDRLRREQTLATKTGLLRTTEDEEEAVDMTHTTTFPDERLELVFTCCQGLLAMMLLHDSRRRARFRHGELVLLADQDRSLWDTDQIAAGRAMLERALALGGRGPYVVQAAIASLHTDETRDWPQVAALYGELARLTDSPVVELNRAVAVAEADGPAAGLRIVDQLDLADYRYLHSTRGELLHRLGRTREAGDAYRRALALVHDDAERRLFERRLAELDTADGSARP